MSVEQREDEELNVHVQVSSRCFFCGRSINRNARRGPGGTVRSFNLSEDFLFTHPGVVHYAQHIFNRYQMDNTNNTCRPCLQRAERFYASMQEEQLRQQSANETMHEPSSSSTSGGIPSDPLRVSGQSSPFEHHAGNEGSVEGSPRLEPLVPEAEPEPEEPEPEREEPESLQSPLNRTMTFESYFRLPISTRFCLVHQCQNRNLNIVQDNLRSLILSQQNIYIAPTVRICNEHDEDIDVWRNLTLYCRQLHTNFSQPQIADMLNLLKNTSTYLNFENINTIDNSTFNYYIGFNKIVFLDIISKSRLLQNLKKPQSSLAAYLCKLHTGDSNERLSSIFRVSPRHFGRIINNVRDCLCTDFMPLYLGFQHIYRDGSNYRDELARRTLSIPNKLYGNPEAPIENRRAIVICDGTYIYMQKSSNYSFQKKSYSLHKHRNLLKTFLIVCPDGYIIEAFGPFAANKSDALIMQELIQNNESSFHWFFKRDDVFILDRGFRDSIPMLEENGYRAYMPITKRPNARQLTTQEANDSRKVTLCRWVVETINGRIKNQFRQLRSVYFNVAGRSMIKDFKIGCALLNAYGARLRDHDLVNQIMEQITLKENSPNNLSDFIEENHFNYMRENREFRRMDAQINIGFPNLTEEELIIMACGTYQLAQAHSYCGEHLKLNGAFYIEIYQDNDNLNNLHLFNINANDPCLIRAKIHSRHSNRTYFVYILLDNSLEGINRIIGHFCYCVPGKRTLGCCSHVMTVVWFLGFARNQPRLPPPPAAFLDTIIRVDIENEANGEF